MIKRLFEKKRKSEYTYEIKTQCNFEQLENKDLEMKQLQKEIAANKVT